MENRILADTNVLLDYFLKRAPFYEESKQIITMCKSGKIEGCIASHSIPNIFYILRNEYSLKERRILLLNMCSIFDVVQLDRDKIVRGLINEDFKDFEDCLQMECAREYGAEYIITRNVSDYKVSEIPAITPGSYLERMSGK